MKRAEQLAWSAFAGLIALLAILLAGGFMYRFTAFWAGSMLVGGQALVVGLAAWGLALARQAAELRELSTLAPKSREGTQMGGGFRMSVGDDASTAGSADKKDEVQTLDTTFQRLMTACAGVVLVLFAALEAWFVYGIYKWQTTHADQPVLIVGTAMDKVARSMDELGLLIGLGAAVLYGILYWITRPKRGSEIYSEATSSTFTLGLPAMVALAAAAVLGYLKVGYASEIAGAVIACFMLLQGLELLVNAIRNYSTIEELDQEAVDLQALPLVPMLSSGWLNGLRLLFAASVGLSGQARHERGVVARMMPRALLAILVIAIAVSCVRVVDPGQVAVLERLGSVQTDAAGKNVLLQPGAHLTMPWPIDQLVYIPTGQLQLTDVGSELHAPKEWGNKVDFQFWTIVDASAEDNHDNEFITADPGAVQLLETFVQVRWRVSDPAMFYNTLSHSDFYEKSGEGATATPIYIAMIQECTDYAVTRAFGIHSLEQILLTQRTEVEQHCQKILQTKLDSLNSGIAVEMLTIADLHPPYWRADRADPNEPPIPSDTPPGQMEQRISRGPASAFEFVVSMREYAEQLRNASQSYQIAVVNQAQGEGQSAIARAEAYKSERIAKANGDALRLLQMLNGIAPENQAFELGLLQQQLEFSNYRNLLGPITKVVVDPRLVVPDLYQNTDKGVLPVVPVNR